MARVLGISALYHDAAAALVEDGVIVAAAQEERFTRTKHDAALPRQALRYCLAEAAGGGGLDAIAFYDKPILKFHRILETAFAVAPRGFGAFARGVPTWLRDKLWVEPDLRAMLAAEGVPAGVPMYFPAHHASHAASAFYPSPFERAAVLTLDGVGEWATASIGVGEGNRVTLREQLEFPHSLGLLYSAFTAFAGFRVGSGEYKLMGLAPYGTPTYAARIRDHLLDLKPDGSFRLNLSYFGYLDDQQMTNARFAALFDGPPRAPEGPLTRRELDLACSIQQVTEDIVLAMARHARAETGMRHLCLAGGVALNCVANGKLLRAGIFDDVWIQPAAGDAGGALGAALAVCHEVLNHPRAVDGRTDSMQGALLGPAFGADSIRAYLDANALPYHEVPDAEWPATVARLIAAGAIVGLFQGRMEFGPRALGNRSIVGDPRSPTMQSVLNQKIKFRESFRPFAPAVLAERAADWFDLDRPSPYMLLVAQLGARHCLADAGDERSLDVVQWVNRVRSTVPAVTHVDRSARVQTVHAETNPRFHALLRAFESQTGCPLLVNTSFNVRGEPIVGTPSDAYRCFMCTGIDALALGPFLLTKAAQPPWVEAGDRRGTLALD
ncbi:MAG: hypothetical protein EXR79_06775 [Myxococcales bacterium]|nr:hypothetical protein [Myxococcales bacterium]